MAKKKQLSKDLYAIAKKCPHLQLCKSTKKGTWLDCRLKKGADCCPGAPYCTQLSYVLSPLTWGEIPTVARQFISRQLVSPTTCKTSAHLTPWLKSPSIFEAQQEPRVTAMLTNGTDYAIKDTESTKQIIKEMDGYMSEKENKKPTITDEQLDKMLADMANAKPIQEVILETIQSLQRDVNLINEKLNRLERPTGQDVAKQENEPSSTNIADYCFSVNDHVTKKLDELNSPKAQWERRMLASSKYKLAYKIYPSFLPVYLFKEGSYLLYTYYNELLDKEIVEHIGSGEFILADKLVDSMYKRHMELDKKIAELSAERRSIDEQLSRDKIDVKELFRE